MSVIDWLNVNQGFVMSLLTLVYVIATVIIVWYNRRSINELQQTREVESRPYVFVYLDKEPRDHCFYLRVKNYGKSIARIDGVEISPKLKLAGDALPEDFLKNVIIAPTQILEFIVLGQKDEIAENDYSVRIFYSSVGKTSKKYCEEYTLTLQYTRQMGYTDSNRRNLNDEANALRNIASHLDSLRRSFR